MISQPLRLGCKPGTDERTPVVRDHDEFLVLLQKSLSHANYEIGQRFKY